MIKSAKMKIVTIALILIAISGSGYFFSEMFGFANGVKQGTINHLIWRQDNTKIYYINLPADLDTTAFKATITLDPTRKIHKIKLPHGGTETNVLIYDSSYLGTIQRNTLPKINPLLKGDFTRDQEVLLDITTLTRGRYYVHYLSCNVGGIFPLTIN